MKAIVFRSKLLAKTANRGYRSAALVAMFMLLWPGCRAPVAEAAQNPKPNIMILLADDIGYGDFGCYGATKIKTPNVDRIAS
jgi:arylsulfatase A